VHSGADLQASASAASGHVPGGAKGYLGYVLANSSGHEVLPLMEAAVEARAELAPALRSSRDVLYLDLALENVVRSAAERGVGHAGGRAAALVAPLLQNLALSLGDNEEVCYCLKAWMDLPPAARGGEQCSKDDALRVRRGAGALLPRTPVVCLSGWGGYARQAGRPWLAALALGCPCSWLSGITPHRSLFRPRIALQACFTRRHLRRPLHRQAMAVVERIRRALADVSDHVSAVVGPVSQDFGQAFGCESWAVQVRRMGCFWGGEAGNRRPPAGQLQQLLAASPQPRPLR
jgi:hypothetical protein